MACGRDISSLYFGMPQIGVKLSPVTAGIIALGVSSGAYVAETIRAGLAAIPRGQVESALALGMNPRIMMVRIVLPQVFRMILPSLTNEAISAVKNTSLLSTITVVELTLYAQLMIATTFRPFDFYIAAALIYLGLILFFITFVVLALSKWLLASMRRQEGAKS